MKNRFPPSRLLLLTLLAATPPATANTYLLDETDLLVDIPEVTSATRLPQKLSEAPASMTIIDRAMIEASGLQTVPDLLRLVPGFQSFMVSSNMHGTTYHGVSDEYPNRLEVMIDGRSVYVPLLSTVVWESLGLHPDNIARIEVVRGSNVPSQGSNAFFGSINIITLAPLASQGITASALVGSQQTRNAHLRWADNNDSLGYWISAGHEQNDGEQRYSTFYTGDWFAADGSDGNWRDDLSRDYLNLSASWTPDLFTNIQLQAGIDRGTKTVGSLDVNDSHVSWRDHESSYGQLRYSELYSDTGTLVVSAYRNQLRMDTPRASVAELLTDFGLPPGLPLSQGVINFLGLGPSRTDGGVPLILDQTIPAGAPVAAFMQAIIDANTFHMKEEEGEAISTDAEIQVTEHFGNFSAVAGAGYRHLEAASEILMQDGAASEERRRAFATLDYDLTPQWQVNSGFMYEYSSADTEAFSYRNAAIFKPDNASSLRLGYSNSERLPSLLERYRAGRLIFPALAPYLSSDVLYNYSTAANPQLDVERIHSWELGYYRALPRLSGYLDLRLFQEQVSNGIYTYTSQYSGEVDSRLRLPSNRNLARWQNDGFELQLKLQPHREFWALFNYAYINTRHDNVRTGDDIDPSSPFDLGGKEFHLASRKPLSPEHTASVLLNWSPTADLDLSLAHYFMDQVHWLEGGKREAYNRTDLRLARRWQADPRTELETALIMQNAFGPAYSEFYQYNRFDRRTYLQLKVRYH